MKSENPKIVLTLLGFAMISQLVLFNIAYTNASFSGEEIHVRDYLSPSQIISAEFDHKLSLIAENLSWSVSTAIAVVKPQALELLGLNDYKFGENRYTSIASQAPLAAAPKVLGATLVNPDYQQGP